MQEARLPGSRRKMSRKLLMLDMADADDMALSNDYWKMCCEP